MVTIQGFLDYIIRPSYYGRTSMCLFSAFSRPSWVTLTLVYTLWSLSISLLCCGIIMPRWWHDQTRKEVSPTSLPNSVPTWVTCKSTPSLPSVFYCFACLTCPLNHILHSSKWQPQTDSYTILLSWHEWHRYCLLYNGSLWLRMLRSEVSSCVITC